ncbi:LacI family transcriptional regulator [Actinomadura rubrobrunea]|uniref:LacI family transcriptional regulator n=1 Tax=Actinomadura rubrobrunea TaxID=115335 RepID=A0A9W6PYV1_9ACTN|nr:LacI family DNA-binding transcriptional regulator [Actinomadura rubrobrunea]GLW66910.1 LacI family transcriptional regulator [Actinomadura rubrobrunea]
MTNEESEPKRPAATRAATMKDVAARVGVSIKTVSRVVNGHDDVHPDTRARIEAAMKELNFRPNVMASMIRRRGGRTASIGLVVEDLANPFMAQLARAVADSALCRQHLVLIGSSDGDPERERELVAVFLTRRVDGLIIVPSGDDQSYLKAETDRGLPIVFVDRLGQRIEADAVVSDNASGTAQAVRHLLAHGHRRIGYLGDLRGFYTAQARLQGYEEALRAATGGVDPRLVRMDVHTVAQAEQEARALLGSDDPPTALLCGNNLITVGALHALQALDLRQKVALIGFDDQDLAHLLTPALTVVAQDVPAIGRTAAERLFLRLNAQPDEQAPYERLTIPVTLIPRGSGEIPAGAPAEHGDRADR